MKPEIHPNYQEITVSCACGHSFKTRSTLGEELHIEICSDCHPFFTGKQKFLDTAGRVERFQKRFSKSAETPVKKAAPAKVAKGQASRNRCGSRCAGRGFDRLDSDRLGLVCPFTYLRLQSRQLALHLLDPAEQARVLCSLRLSMRRACRHGESQSRAEQGRCL